MIKKSYITVKSTWGHDINNLYLTHAPKSESIVILFPGADYCCDKPLLHYARKATLLSGCDVLSLEYGYFKTDNFYKPDFLENTLNEVKEAVHLCLSNSYKNIYFISKSLGTTIAGEISKSLGYDKVNNLFLTPLVNTIEYIASTKCTVIVGSKDKQFSKEHIDKIGLFPSVDLHVIDNTAHSLEVEDSCKGSLEILARVTNLYENFVCKNRKQVSIG